jgi:hypothetical protein
MLQLMDVEQHRRVIAGILLQMVLVVVLPASWLHCHGHATTPSSAQVRHADAMQKILVASASAEDDHCTFCSHAWPGFIANEQVPVVCSPSIVSFRTPITGTSFCQDLAAITDGRGPPEFC